MIEDRRGELWVGAGSGLYRRFADGRVERYTTQHGLPYNDVRSLLEDRQGQLWVGTTLGLCRMAFQPGSARPVVARVYNAKDGLSNNWVTSLLEASDGRLWLANSELNLFVTSPDKKERFQKYTTEHGLSSNSITALAEDEDGNLWIGSRGGAMKMGRNGLITYGKADGFTNTAIKSIFENQMGELCVVDGNGTINRFDGKRSGRSRRARVDQRVASLQ